VVIRWRLGFAIVVVAAACRPAAPRYAVTATPIDVGGGLPALCVAVDAADPHGAWWWHPGRTGCASRGSSVMNDGLAAVSSSDAAVTVGFGIGTVRGTTVAVRLVFEGAEIRSGTGARVAVERRGDLNVPELPPFGPGPRGGGGR
jgi:hypothetical protein